MGSRSKAPTRVDRHVGSRIRLRRMLVGMTQTELGARAGGITFQQIQKYEKGTNRITVSRLDQIADALGAPLEYFYGAGDSERSPSRPAAKATQELTSLLASADALRLIRAFENIPGRKVRLTVIRLAESLAVRHARASRAH